MSHEAGWTPEELEYQKNLEKEIRDWESKVLAIPSTASEPVTKAAGLTEPEIKYMLYHPLQSKKEMQNWIKFFLKVDLPDSTIDPDSNSNPLEMVWKIYQTAVHYQKLAEHERHIKSLFYCSRGSFKTLCACIVELLVMIHTGRNTLHIGLIESQAKNAYNMYFRPFLAKPYINEWAKKNSILEKSEVNHIKLKKDDTLDEANPQTTTLQVIPLTLNKTSSPRANLVVKDEIDKVKGEQVQAYENVYGTLTMTNQKEMAMEFDISSRDSSHGMVQEVIDNADKTGCKVYHWNRIDITERCPDSRSGKSPTPIYTKKDTLIAISEEEYEELDNETKKLYRLEWGLDGCLKNCKMFGACRGYLKNQRSKCKWLKPIKETEQAILGAPSEEMAISQLLCRIPPKIGLVYSDFDHSKNIKSPWQMYLEWRGTPHKNLKLTTDELIKEFQKAGLACYVGVDAGFHHPACLLIYIDEKDKVYVVKEHMPEDVDSEELSDWLQENWSKYTPLKVYVDPESPDCTRFVRKKGFTVSTKVDKKRQPGIATVKGFIRRPATQITELFLNKECMGTRYEFLHWSYKKEPTGNYSDETEKRNDHAMDALRYVLHTLYGQARGNVHVDSKKRKLGFETADEYTAAGKALNKERMSPHSVAAKLGQIVVDNRHLIEEKKDDDTPKRKGTTGFDPNDM